MSVEPRTARRAADVAAVCRSWRRRAGTGAAMALLSSLAWAQVPVIESRGVSPDAGRSEQPSRQDLRPQARQVADTAGGSGGSMAELFHQLQLMQLEIQELRGLVEEQSHQLERLARTQREQYIDVDRRLSELTGGGPAPRPGLGVGDLVMPQVDLTEAAGATGGRPSATETEAYASAFDMTRERRFEEAITAFEHLIENFPNGQYTANAHYWLGELYLALPEPRLDESQAAFEHVIDVYPTHQKVPDSLYKLGVVFHMKGDTGAARSHLQRVRDEHSGTQAARLAESYAAELR